MDAFQARLQEALPERYVLKHEIGRGGMAIVFLAWDRIFECDVALKVLRPELSATLGPSRFLQEIKTAARLKHPYILKLHNSDQAGGFLYYVMPWLEGDTLRQRLVQNGPLPLNDALRIAREVAEALDHAHKNGVVHRDIKPENILFEAGHAVVSDFGIALAVSEAAPRTTGSGTVLGTLEYMSPEHAAGVVELDGRTDIYSLGIVLYEMLIGKVPSVDFEGITRTFERQRPDVPASVLEILRRSLASNREDRFATGQQLADALSRVGAPSKWLSVAVATVLIAVGAMAVWGVGADSKETNSLDPTHIGVLYLDDMSPDSSLAAVAAGLSEDLMDRLAQVSALRVTSQNGVRPYRGRAVPPDSLARALDVGTIVAGSVTRSGNILRVTVRLVDGATGQLLHSRQVSRPYGELFALQDTITADITAFLRLRIGEAVVLRERKAGAANVTAWELVRQADALQQGGVTAVRSGDDSGSVRLLRSADSLYREARAADRRWSVPLIGRARVAQAFAELISEARQPQVVRQALETPLPARPRYEDEWIRVGMANTDSALRLESRNAEAFELRGSLRYLWWLRGYATAAESLSASERDFQTAVLEQPRLARAWARLSQLLRYTGRFAEAEQAAQRALEADAFLLEARAVYRTLLFTALNLQQFDTARAWCDRGRNRFPTDAEFKHCELRILGWSSRGRIALSQAWRLTDSLDAGPPPQRTGVYAAERRLLLAALYARTSLADSARILLEAARRASEGDSAATWFLLAESNVRLMLGERRVALRLIERGLATSPQLRDYVSRAPWFARLRNDPEFIRLVTRAS